MPWLAAAGTDRYPLRVFLLPFNISRLSVSRHVERAPDRIDVAGEVVVPFVGEPTARICPQRTLEVWIDGFLHFLNDRGPLRERLRVPAGDRTIPALRDPELRAADQMRSARIVDLVLEIVHDGLVITRQVDVRRALEECIPEEVGIREPLKSQIGRASCRERV